MLRIALLGYGTVGQSVAALTADGRRGIELRHILRRPGKAAAPLMTDSPDDVFADPDVDVVVDVLPGENPSYEYIRRALLANKHVVTANKAALAPHYAELTTLARENGCALLYEASAGGGIPWIENLRQAAKVDRITAMSGILNGTVNYIIDRMERFEADFETALSEAQALGYAEADPAADLSGADTANKAVISAATALNAAVSPNFPVAGIEGLTRDFLELLHREGLTLRLMMLFCRSEHRYALGVAPVLLSGHAMEAAVRENFNCTSLTGDVVGTLKFYGQGAGGRPTADAILQDLVRLRDGRAEPPSAPAAETPLYDASLLTGTAYFADGTRCFGTLETLTLQARELNCFMAFQPQE